MYKHKAYLICVLKGEVFMDGLLASSNLYEDWDSEFKELIITLKCHMKDPFNILIFQPVLSFYILLCKWWFL